MIEILHEDDYCILVSKPNNVLVHHAHHSRNKIEESSLLQLLEQQGVEKCYPVHRLDRKTSGIILLAKKTEYVAKFQALFTDHKIQKTYYGIVRGWAPESRVIDSPVKGRDSDVYKDAETHVKCLEKITLNVAVRPYRSSRYSLIELKPKTGRLHQLRIHLNKISHPLINDPKYGDKNHNMMFEREFGCTKMFLHAGSLKFKHPFTDQNLFFAAEFSEDWKKLFSEFQWRNPLL